MDTKISTNSQFPQNRRTVKFYELPECSKKFTHKFVRVKATDEICGYEKSSTLKNLFLPKIDNKRSITGYFVYELRTQILDDVNTILLLLEKFFAFIY